MGLFEENFNKRAEEMQSDMRRLAAAKADRLEIQQMQESLVKTEAMLQKFSTQYKSSDLSKIKSMLTREQIMELLEKKMDRADFDAQIANIGKLMKKKKRDMLLGKTESAPVIAAEHDILDDDITTTSKGTELLSARMAEHLGTARETIPSARERAMKSPGGLEYEESPYPTEEAYGRAAVEIPQSQEPATGHQPKRMDPHSEITDYMRTPTVQKKVPPQFIGGHGQDLSVLGAKTIGGGFNTKKTQPTAQGEMKPLNEPIGRGVDVEGEGHMLEGSDGHLYYGDDLQAREQLATSLNLQNPSM